MMELPRGETEDAALVAAALAGDESSFAELVERYKGVIYAIGWSALKNTADAEDAVAETFALAYRKLPGLEQHDRFGSWLRRIAYNVVAQAMHRRHLRQLRLARIDEGQLCALPAADPSAETEFPPRLLSQSMNSLSAEERAVCTLFYLLDMNQVQIARDLQVPLGTVKSRLNRARKTLARSIITMAKQNPCIENDDYGRSVIAGNRGVIQWQKLLGANGLEGWQAFSPAADVFSRRGDAFIGEAPADTGGRLMAGTQEWTDYELSC